MRALTGIQVVGGKEHDGAPKGVEESDTGFTSSTARILANRPGKPKTVLADGQEAEMENVTPAHLNAEIKAVERLVETRYVELKSGIEKIATSIDASQVQNSKDMARVEHLIEGNFSKLDQKIDQKANENNMHYKTVFWTTIGIAIAAVTLMIGTYAAILQGISVGQSIN